MLQRRTRNQNEVALAANIFEANLFGPQSRWSSLLGQREHLENEIYRGRKYLSRLEKDLADCDALVQAWPARRPRTARNGRGSRASHSMATSSMVQFLEGWLDHLQQRLTAVNREIQAMEVQNEAETILPEESMFALLRAAG